MNDSTNDWEYKSIATLADEQFCGCNPYWITSNIKNDPPLQGIFPRAAAEFASCINYSLQRFSEGVPV